MFRKTIFWIHLVCGLGAGLVVLMMSVTGVLLTYERQMIGWAEFRGYQPPTKEMQRLAIPALISAATTHNPEFQTSSIQVFSSRNKPVVLSGGQSRLIMSPYTAEVVGNGSSAEGMREFFSLITGWHRWFNTSGESRATARAITGASNLIFLFLVFSGIYLWFPAFWNWASFRTRLLFRNDPMTSKARDFNWHHVMGFWSAIPLAVVVAAATVFYYPWANTLLYRSFGEEPPAGGRGGGQQSSAPAVEPNSPDSLLTYDELLEIASQHLEDWQSISLTLSDSPGPTTSFSLDQGDGGQPQLRHSLVLDTQTGDIASWAPFSSQTPGRQARSWVRFLHTGEALGIVGQTIAGLVSLAGVFLVWTGFALAYRRLILPLTRKQKSAG